MRIIINMVNIIVLFILFLFIGFIYLDYIDLKDEVKDYKIINKYLNVKADGYDRISDKYKECMYNNSIIKENIREYLEKTKTSDIK